MVFDPPGGPGAHDVEVVAVDRRHPLEANLIFRLTLGIVFSFLCILAPASSSYAADQGARQISRDAMDRSIRTNFGNLRTDYYGRRMLVRDQLWMGLGNPDRDTSLLGGNYLVSGCRPASCDEKTAVIVTRSGKMLIAGLVGLPGLKHCRLDTACDETPMLTIYVKRANDNPVLVREIKDWAETKGVTRSEIRILP